MRPSSTRSPRSVMRTTTECLFDGLMTLTMEPKGRVGWQAVRAFISKRSPLAVLRPLKILPYQEAIPWSLSPRLIADFWASRDSGAGCVTGDGAATTVTTGRGSRASACTVRAAKVVTTKAASAIDEAPASNQTRSEVFRFKLRDFLLMTIWLFYQLATRSTPLIGENDTGISVDKYRHFR